jgi:hypothetical protein
MRRPTARPEPEYVLRYFCCWLEDAQLLYSHGQHSVLVPVGVLGVGSHGYPIESERGADGPGAFLLLPETKEAPKKLLFVSQKFCDLDCCNEGLPRPARVSMPKIVLGYADNFFVRFIAHLLARAEHQLQ